MKSIKSILICTLILGGLFVGFTFFEYILLMIFGLHYTSITALIIFFAMYAILEVPFSLITKGLSKAMVSLSFIRKSNGLFATFLHFAFTFTLLSVLDAFYDGVEISTVGAVLFAIVITVLNWLLYRTDEEPPEVGSKQYEKIGKTFQ